MTATSEPADLGVPPKLAPPDADQKKAIEEKIGYYVEGLRKGDVGTLMKAFRDEAIVCGYIDKESFVQPVSYLYRFVLANPSPAKTGQRYDCAITDIQVVGKVAVATVSEVNYLGTDYMTTFHLIHLPDAGDDMRPAGWWIVSKLFEGVSPTPGT
jgi:Putative lumazine-binding